MTALRALLVFAALLTSAVAVAKPTALEPSEKEWVQIEKGEVVSRNAPELDPPGAYAWVLIEAPPEKVWDVLNDPSEAAAASGAVESVTTYIDEPTAHGKKIGLHYVLNVAWTEVTYYVIRDFRPKEGWMTWTLDPDKESDLVHTSGHYVVAPGKREGTVLLSYKTQADSGRSVPQWIQQMLTGRALKGYLGHVKKIAEAG